MDDSRAVIVAACSENVTHFSSRLPWMTKPPLGNETARTQDGGALDLISTADRIGDQLLHRFLRGSRAERFLKPRAPEEKFESLVGYREIETALAQPGALFSYGEPAISR